MEELSWASWRPLHTSFGSTRNNHSLVKMIREVILTASEEKIQNDLELATSHLPQKKSQSDKPKPKKLCLEKKLCDVILSIPRGIVSSLKGNKSFTSRDYIVPILIS